MKNPEKNIKQDCRVINQKGLHARAAAQIVTLSNQYQSKLTLTHKNKSACGLSLIKLLTLDAPRGSEVTISVEGVDAETASQAINQLFADGFGELGELSPAKQREDKKS